MNMFKFQNMCKSDPVIGKFLRHRKINCNRGGKTKSQKNKFHIFKIYYTERTTKYFFYGKIQINCFSKATFSIFIFFLCQKSSKNLILNIIV